MKANAANSEVDGSPPGTSLGGRLVAARESKGLTLQVVASKLRLSAATLQALELNRYEDLPEPIFVRGYLRAYARLLEMDGQALVAEYDRCVAEFGPALVPSTGVRRQAKVRGAYPRVAIALIVVVMVVVFGSWWYSRVTHDVPAQIRAVSSEGEQPASPATVHPSPQIDFPTPAPVPAAALTPDSSPPSPASGTAEQHVVAAEPESPVSETDAPARPAESPVTANADAAANRGHAEATVEPAVPDLPIAPRASERGRLVRASRAPTGDDVLAIKTNDESWAEVVDANGYQLLYYPLRPGRVLTLQGQAPFRVFLGNAPAVDLSLNRKRFDHTPFRHRNNTARFTVDDASGT